MVFLDRDARASAAGRTARATRSAAAGTRRAPAAAASRARRARAAAISARRKRTPGKKYALAIRISRLRRADRGQVGALDVAAVAQVVADHELRRLRAGALRPRVGSGNSGTSRAARAARARRAPTPAASSARSARAADPRTRTAKSTRGGLWPGVFMSSMMLMPPTNAIRPSTWHELAMQPPQPVRAELPRRDLRPVLHAAARRPSRSAPLERGASGSACAPQPSTSTRTVTPRRAARTSASATARPAASSAKM